MGSGWENPGPARQVIIDGKSGELLVYNGSRRQGTLMLSVSGQAGSDPFGNTFPKGLYFPIDFVGQVGPQHTEYVQWGDTFGVVLSRLFLERANTGAPPEMHLEVLDPNGTNLGKIQLGTAGKGNGAGVQIGNGKIGLAHSLNATWSASRASGALSAITAVTVGQIDSDYPSSGFTGGSWSPPVDGYYDVWFGQNATTGSTRGAAIIVKNGAAEIEHQEAPNNTGVSAKLVSEYLLTTDVLTFEPFFVSATTPQTLTGRLNISRRAT